MRKTEKALLAAVIVCCTNLAAQGIYGVHADHAPSAGRYWFEIVIPYLLLVIICSFVVSQHLGRTRACWKADKQ